MGSQQLMSDVSNSSINAPAAISFSSTDSNWTVISGSSPITGTARTATVPVGNSGKVTLNITKAGTITTQYSINAGTFTTFSSGTIITLADGQTLNFRGTSALSGGIMDGTVNDTDSSTVIGNADIEHS